MKLRTPVLVVTAALVVMANPAWPQFGDQPAAAEPERHQVGETVAVAAKDLPDVLARVQALIDPATLEELAAPSPSAGGLSMGSGVAVGSQMRTREDGVKLTIMSAQKGQNSPPANVGVWHGTGNDSNAGGLAALFGGSPGKLVLRLHDPAADALPFGFRRVRLFSDGTEQEYVLDDGGRWTMRRYENAER